MATRGEQSPLTKHTVVDADVHLRIPLEDLADYCDEPYRSSIKNPTYTPVNRSGWDRYMGGNITKESLPDAETLNEKVCEGFNVEYPIINAFPVLASVPESDKAVNMMYAYNDYLVEHYLDHYDHFRGLVSIATQDPEAAAEEIDRMADEDGIVGVYVLNSGAHLPLGNPDFDPVYRAAEDNGLHVAFHASAGAPFARDFPIQDNAIDRFAATHVLAHPWAHMLTLSSLIVNGTFEKFPDLNFTFLEAGVSWVPYMMFRWNKEYGMRRREAPLLERSPEEYIRESCYFASQPIGEPNDPTHLRSIIDLIGTDRLMLATDYPHWDFDHPDALDGHLRRFYEPEDRERVLSGTAGEAFGLDV
jgi:predicted TIM-barrel fold metal-dependent hydrolase